MSDVSAHNWFDPWAKPTVFATGESGSVFALLGRINRVCNRYWKLGPVDLTFVISDLTFCDLRVVTGKCDVIYQIISVFES